ncbi:hypothetical protein HK098_003772 [Nowakowskiella sp. JEL0407]|nr:hypothetical protein HK098_003772 [Nowakowskiella sp. JEL0407]
MSTPTPTVPQNDACNTALDAAEKGLYLSCNSQNSPTSISEFEPWITNFMKSYCTQSACYNFVPSVAGNIKSVCPQGYVGNINRGTRNATISADYFRTTSTWTQDQIDSSPECYSENGNCVAKLETALNTNQTTLICTPCTQNMVKLWRDYPSTSTSGGLIITDITKFADSLTTVCGTSFLAGKASPIAKSSSSPSSTAGANTSGNTNSGPNIGAIAGGIIGGLAVIGIIIGLFFFMRKKKSDKNTVPIQQQPPLIMANYPMVNSAPSVPSSQPVYYDYNNVPKDPTGRPMLPQDPHTKLYYWTPQQSSQPPSFNQPPTTPVTQFPQEQIPVVMPENKDNTFIHAPPTPNSAGMTQFHNPYSVNSAGSSAPSSQTTYNNQ